MTSIRPKEKGKEKYKKILFLTAFSTLLSLTGFVGYIYAGEGGGSPDNCIDGQDNDSDTFTDISDIECVDPPSTPDLRVDSDTGSSNTDNLTNDDTPDIEVACTSGSLSIRLYKGGAQVGTDASCSGGSSVTFSFFSSSATLSEGINTITATHINGNGESGASGALSVTLDTTVPVAPSTPDLQAGSDNGSSNTDNTTNDTTPTLDVSCESGTTVELLSGGVQGTGTCSAATVAITTSSALSAGSYSFTARQTDVAGNTSSESGVIDPPVTIDTTAPTTSGAPDMTSSTDSGSSDTDNITNDNTPTFSGSCTTNGNIVQLYDDGVSSGSSGACTDGLSFTLTTGTLATGANSITFKETDTAGNTSTASTALSPVTIDTTAPVISSVTPATSATINNVTSSSDIAYTLSEAVASGSITITRTSGTADGNSPHTCTLKGTGLNSGAHTIDLSDTTNGCTSDVSNLVSGTVYTFVFAGTDTAGNAATAITRTSVTFDNTAPTISSVSSDKAAGSYTVGEVIDIDVTFLEAVTSTGDVTVTLETGDTDRTCTFTVSGATTGTCNYTVQSGDTSSDLAATISGTISDAAGNAMSSFTPTTGLAVNETLVIDTTAPVISEVTAVTTPTSNSSPSYTFTSSESGVITYGGSCSSATTAASSGSNTITLVALADGTYADCTIIVTDAPGNAGNTLSITSFTVNTVVAVTSTNNSGSRGGGIIFSNYTPNILPTSLNTFINTISNFIPSFLKSEESDEQEEIAVEPTPTLEDPELSLEGDWDLIPDSTINRFVLADLPSEINDLISKFPELGEVFASLGVADVSDLSRLQDITFNLPKIADRADPPTEVIFAKTGEGGIPVSSSLSVTEDGVVEQKIHTLGGTPIVLQIKPEGKAESVKGFLTFKKKAESVAANFPTNSLLASAMIALESLGEEAQASTVGPELLIFEFEYTDPDGDGIYTADIQTPQVEGEYEVITIIDYSDKKQGSKELRMVTVIDPEGYIYERNGQGRETRIDDAKVSIFEIRSGEESLWNAEKYSQDNPQTTDKTGKYAFLVPEGTYFLTVESGGHDFYKGEPFEVKEGNPVHENIELVQRNGWLYNLLDWKVGIISIVLAIYVTRLIDRRKRLI